MMITEKDVFGAMLENVEKRAVEKLYDAKTFDEVEGELGIHPADDTSLDDYYASQVEN